MNQRTKYSAAALLLTVAFSSAARADVYHPVENNDSLTSIANRYHISVEAIRKANGLGNFSANDALPAMLLRIPSEKDAAKSLSTQESNRGDGFGKVTTLAVHTVKEGETLQDVATRYGVSTETIRQKNDLSGVPAAGTRLLIPQKTQTYGGGRNTLGTNSALAIPADNPTFELPMYQSISVTPKTSATSSMARRGPTNLASRGYSPSARQFSDGSRVLGQNDYAPNVGTSPQPRQRVATSTQLPASMARVGRIARNGARIRRLPESSAATLYHCNVGTELAVLRENGAWSAILMSDRSTGWIPTRYLSFSGVTVDISTQVITGSAAQNYSYADRRGIAIAGNFRSDNPYVAHALTWLGTRYVYGGTTRRGVDCSSLVQHSFAANGIRLPRTAAQQARVGRSVDASNLMPGDRLYFSASGSRIDHTGIYMGNGLFVHASGSGRRVIVSKLADRRNWNIFVGARR